MDALDLAAAQRLPPNIRFGTSSWTYPGWNGLIYREHYKNAKEFNRNCLGEYVRCPWFRTVGIDSTFYSAPSPEMLAHYAQLVPTDFQWVSKAWERITIPKYPALPRYGKVAGELNSDFLNADLFVRESLRVFEQPHLREHIGPIVFQFPTIERSVLTKETFFERLKKFLAALPQEFRYAVEIRNREYLCNEYFQLINECGATHCFNHWHRMPALREQMVAAAMAGGLKADFYVARILTPLGVSYEQAVKLFEPYDAIKRPNQEMRADVKKIALRAISRGNTAFIIVNNRSEGSAPYTIDAIGKLITTEL